MTISSKFATISRAELLCFIFYTITGIILLTLLPLTSFAPHLALVGILSLVTAITLLTKKNWFIWLVAVLFVVVAVFTLSTIFSIGSSNMLLTAGLVAYFVLALIATVFLGLVRKRN